MSKKNTTGGQVLHSPAPFSSLQRISMEDSRSLVLDANNVAVGIVGAPDPETQAANLALFKAAPAMLGELYGFYRDVVNAYNMAASLYTKETDLQKRMQLKGQAETLMARLHRLEDVFIEAGVKIVQTAANDQKPAIITDTRGNA